MMTMNGETMYFNLICEEVYLTGGKIIHIDTNVGSVDEAGLCVKRNIHKYPNGKWELYPIIIET